MVPRISLYYLSCFLIFFPIPFGLRLQELTLLALVGLSFIFLSGVKNFSIRKNTALFLLIVLLSTTVSVLRGESISYFQFFRGALFPLITVWLCGANFDKRFLDVLEKMVPIIIFGMYLSVIAFYVFDSTLYNSELDMSFDISLFKRLYVYQGYFVLILFVDAVLRNNKLQFILLPLILASSSKAILLVVVITYLISIVTLKPLKRSVMSIVMLIPVTGLAILSSIPERVAEFRVRGDPWRMNEPLIALEKILDFPRLFIGNGAGVKYWNGYVELLHNPDYARLFENSMYDVHNGFVVILLRFGVFGAIIYWMSIKKIIPKVKGIVGFTFPIIIGLLIFLSHGPVQTVGSVGMVLALIVINHRNMKSSIDIVRKSKSSHRSSSMRNVNTSE